MGTPRDGLPSIPPIGTNPPTIIDIATVLYCVLTDSDVTDIYLHDLQIATLPENQTLNQLIFYEKLCGWIHMCYRLILVQILPLHHYARILVNRDSNRPLWVKHMLLHESLVIGQFWSPGNQTFWPHLRSPPLHK